ncbi:hypothetical protein MP638_002471 [Amoeboaphelidium occidentale]|nr:hypothetical protein MP638_002471 [Amoeboaphelidium occidentale]
MKRLVLHKETATEPDRILHYQTTQSTALIRENKMLFQKFNSYCAEAESILLNLYITYKQQLHQQNQFSSHLLLLISQLDPNFDKPQLLGFKDGLPLLDATEFEQEISKLRQIDSRASLLESANESLETAYVTLTKQLKDIVKGFQGEREETAYVTLTKQLKDIVKGFQDEREGYEITAQSLRSMISHFEKELALSHDKLVELHALVKEERHALETKDQFREKEMEVLRKALRDQIAISHNLRAENGYLEGRLKEISLSYRDVTPSSDRPKIIAADADYDSVHKEIQHLQEENARLVTLLQNTNGGKGLSGATDLELELESVKKKLENQQKINKKIRKIIMQTMTVGVPSVAEDLELTVPEEIAPVLMQSIDEDNTVGDSPRRETFYSKRMSKTQTSLGSDSLEKDEFYSTRMAQTQVSLGQTNAESSLGRSQVSLTPFNLVNNNAAISNHIQLIDMYNHALTTISHLQVNNEILQKKLEDSNSSRRQTETMTGIFLSQERKPSAINGSDTELTKLAEERDAWKDNTRRLEKEIWEVREMLQQKENALNELKKGQLVETDAEVTGVQEKQDLEEKKPKAKDTNRSMSLYSMYVLFVPM